MHRCVVNRVVVWLHILGLYWCLKTIDKNVVSKIIIHQNVWVCCATTIMASAEIASNMQNSGTKCLVKTTSCCS